MSERLLHTASVSSLGSGNGGKRGLDGVGVGTEPIEEGGFAKHAGIGDLGGMNVSI